jgi:acyl carrier protein phosphodiesterase
VNYLMHSILSGPNPEILIGNLFGDLVKGSDFAGLGPGITAGIQLHRSIDIFADHHPAVLRSQRRLASEWSRVAGIIMDVYYDHVLALRWSHYSALPLRSYLDHLYETLNCHEDDLPENMRLHARRLVSSDLLYTYRNIEDIALALRRISKRFRRAQWNLEPAVPALLEAAEDIEQDFRDWMKDALPFAAGRLAELRIA